MRFVSCNCWLHKPQTNLIAVISKISILFYYCLKELLIVFFFKIIYNFLSTFFLFIWPSEFFQLRYKLLSASLFLSKFLVFIAIWLIEQLYKNITFWLHSKMIVFVKLLNIIIKGFIERINPTQQFLLFVVNNSF